MKTSKTITDIATQLLARAYRLATAESCTGGGVSALLTQLPGSSEWFDRGFVTYSNAAKSEMLGIAPALIATHGAVAPPSVIARSALAPPSVIARSALAPPSVMARSAVAPPPVIARSAQPPRPSWRGAL